MYNMSRVKPITKLAVPLILQLVTVMSCVKSIADTNLRTREGNLAITAKIVNSVKSIPSSARTTLPTAPAEDDHKPEQIRISNLTFIDLQVTLSFPDGTKIQQPTLLKIGDKEASLELEIIRHDVTGDTKVIPAKIRVIAVDERPSSLNMRVLFEIPVDSNQVKLDAISYLNKIHSLDSAKLNLSTVPVTITPDDPMVKTMSSLATQNIPGNYSLVCKYSADDAATWKGSVQSSPIEFVIIDDGSFFERLLKIQAERTHAPSTQPKL